MEFTFQLWNINLRPSIDNFIVFQVLDKMWAFSRDEVKGVLFQILSWTIFYKTRIRISKSSSTWLFQISLCFKPTESYLAPSSWKSWLRPWLLACEPGKSMYTNSCKDTELFRCLYSFSLIRTKGAKIFFLCCINFMLNSFPRLFHC